MLINLNETNEYKISSHKSAAEADFYKILHKAIKRAAFK